MSVEFITSSKLPIKHGFFTRQGGKSVGDVASLNASEYLDTSAEAVEQNRQLVAKALGLERANMVLLGKLQHSNRVAVVSQDSRGKLYEHYDALVTNTADTPLCLWVADCAPIILYDTNHHALGLVHAGWRGAQAGVIAAAVAAMQELYDTKPAELSAVIGPTIAAESYEIQQDVGQLFSKRYAYKLKGKLVLNLPRLINDQLSELGISDIDDVGIDTYTDNRFYSHRRDKGKTGRFFAVASL